MADKLYTIEEYLESLKTPKGGYTRETLLTLGVKWPPKKGWKRDIIMAVKQNPKYTNNTQG